MSNPKLGYTIQGLLYWLTLIAAWISNHIASEVCDEITSPFPHFLMYETHADIEVIAY